MCAGGTWAVRRLFGPVFGIAAKNAAGVAADATSELTALAAAGGVLLAAAVAVHLWGVVVPGDDRRRWLGLFERS